MVSIGIGLVACAVAFMVAAFLFVRFAQLPAWTHRDLLAFTALVATIGGAMILTILKWVQADKFNEQSDRLISELVRERPSTVNDAVGEALATIIDSVTWSFKLDSIGIIVVLLSLGLVISSRVIKGKILGNELEMSNSTQDAAAAGARAAADSADATATNIEAGATPAVLQDAAPTARP